MRKLIVVLAAGALLLHGPHAEALPSQPDIVMEGFNYDDVYPPSVQSTVKKAKRGKSAVFELDFQNDDPTTPDTLTIDGCSSSKGFSVTYEDASGDVTAAMSAGTYTTSLLVPGDSASATATVKVKRRGPRVKDCVVRATSAVTPSAFDEVHAITKVRR